MKKYGRNRTAQRERNLLERIEQIAAKDSKAYQALLLLIARLVEKNSSKT